MSISSPPHKPSKLHNWAAIAGICGLPISLLALFLTSLELGAVRALREEERMELVELREKDRADRIVNAWTNINSRGGGVATSLNVLISEGETITNRDLGSQTLIGWVPPKGTDMRWSSFENANLYGAQIKEASLRRTDFFCAYIAAADFSGSAVNETSFVGARILEEPDVPQRLPVFKNLQGSNGSGPRVYVLRDPREFEWFSGLLEELRTLEGIEALSMHQKQLSSLIQSVFRLMKVQKVFLSQKHFGGPFGTEDQPMEVDIRQPPQCFFDYLEREGVDPRIAKLHYGVRIPYDLEEYLQLGG